MSAGKHTSIRARLIAVIMKVTALTLLIALCTFGLFDAMGFRRQMALDLTASAEIVAANSAAAMIFNDTLAAQETLSSLGDREHILTACLKTPDGQTFAEYVNPTATDPLLHAPENEKGHGFAKGRLFVHQPIQLDGEHLGTVYLEASQRPLYARLLNQAKIGLVVLLLSMVVAYLLTTRLERVITGPIIELADTARQISGNKDYSLRGTRKSDDELGHLIDDFNHMLSEIEYRDLALTQSEKYFRSLIEHGNDIIVRVDAEGIIRYASPSATRLLSQSAEKLYGRSLFDFIHPDDQASARHLLRAIPAEVYTNECRLGYEASGWTMLECIASNLLDDPAVQGIVINSRDITERKAAERKLETFARSLEQRNRELQDFAHVASHDLQEPLRKIQAFGERLQHKCGADIGEQGLDYLDRMTNAAQRMQELITSLLEFSRVTSQARPYAPVDLAQITREVLGDLEIAIERSKTEVIVDALPVIDGDPMQIRQLLQNLIGNALKF